MLKMLLRRMEGYENWRETGRVNWDMLSNGLTGFGRLPNEMKKVKVVAIVVPDVS